MKSAADLYGFGCKPSRYSLATLPISDMERKHEAMLRRLGPDGRALMQYVMEQEPKFSYRSARRYFKAWSDQRFYAALGVLFVNDMIENET